MALLGLQVVLLDQGLALLVLRVASAGAVVSSGSPGELLGQQLVLLVFVMD